MKPVGLIFSILGTAAMGILLVFDFHNHLQWPAISLIATVTNIGLLLGWLFWFNPEWVRIAGEAYAERLLAACENL
jgi:hypothetical protein